MITLECNYSKKLGLPNYSSHQFAITLRTEISDLAQVQAESARLYKILQDGVDTSIKQTGYLPGSQGNGGSNGGNGHGRSEQNGNGNGNGSTPGRVNDVWNCSPKQQGLIQKIVTEHHLDKNQIAALAGERFGKPVPALNKLEASGLIEELLEMTNQGRGNGRSRFQKAGAR